MGQIFECNNDIVVKQKYQQRLKVAKKRLSHYPVLNDILKNFNQFEDYARASSRNIILNITMPKFDEGDWKDGEYSPSILENLEQALHYLKEKLSKNEFNELVSRLTSSNSFTGNSALTEVLTAYEIGHRIGFQKIEYQHKLTSGKRPDFYLNFDNKNISLELTLLNSRFSEIKIANILTELVKYLLKKSTNKKNYLISIYFDTSNLILDDDKNIDEEKSKFYLFNAVNKLFLNELIGWTGKIEFPQVNIAEDDRYVYDLLNDAETVLENNALRLVDSSKKNSLVENWSKRVLLSDFSHSPFENIAFFETKNNNECVEIQTVDTDTTDPVMQDSELFSTSTKIKSAFIAQIRKKIDEKVKEGQFDVGSPAIIAIHASEWRFDYENDYDDFIQIRNSIQEHLKKYPYLSGVIIFYSTVYNGKYIENTEAHPKIKLSKTDLEEAELIKKVSEPLLTKDKAKKLNDLSEDQKTETIKEVLEKEKNLILEDDKRALLENIYDYLEIKTIDSQLLDEVESIIKKYCNYDEELDDGLSSRDGSILANTMILVNPIPVKALAAGCLCRLFKHKATDDNLILAKSLSNHHNSYVREHIARDLQYICTVDTSSAYSIGTRFIEDNKFVRWYLQAYLYYLGMKDPEMFHESCKNILERYGKIQLPKDENAILTIAVEISIYLSLLRNEKQFYPIIDDLVYNSEYNYFVKRQLAFTLRNENLLFNTKLTEKILLYYTKLMNSDSKEVRADVSFSLLYKLLEKEISFIPKIFPFLEKVSAEEYPEKVFGRAQIIDYLDMFCLEFPEKAGEYLVRLIEINPHLISSPLYLKHIFNIISKLLDFQVPDPLKVDLITILERMTQNDYVNLNLPEAKELLSNFTDK